MLGKLIFGFNVTVAIALLLTCILSFFSIQIIPVLSVLSLSVPFLFIVNVLFLLYWIYRKKRKFLWSLAALAMGYFVFGPFYGVGNKNQDADETSDLRIMTFNVWHFNKNEWIKEPNIGDRIIDFIKAEKPDILCIQEFHRERKDELSQYPYNSITPDSVGKITQGIFSKYPILNKGSIDFPGTINNVIYVDLLVRSDTIRVYNMHLQSFSIVPSSETFSEKESEKTYKRLVNTFSKQLEQAKIFNDHVKQSPYSTIVCGDLNNTQFSNIYRIVRDDLQDSFLEKGNGFGRTYKIFNFPLRIDYVLADASFQVISHTNFDEMLSDHYPVAATLRYTSH
ncbi:endonuclease/exonuclease/phosphatase family protein [Flagellimonas sp. HMM57]|uniref:endonuclease/exonuclease/phosphatase family protein n=1 Tax=unclassified Flagellimonas TaxID=2644544 RepID=UPI0013D2F05B|nr:MULTISPECIES: endonuclease/exonuclease/phosphatase family protein [unclassified Flagellimonas]UII75282.1 endonuclease/exonuclease/phosphatase family protein [Flagellimonas sp. HMM57]